MEHMVIGILLGIGIAAAAFFLTRRNRAAPAPADLPDEFTKTNLEATLLIVQQLASKLEGKHEAIVLEKDRIISSTQTTNDSYATWTREYEQRVKRIDDSLDSISKQAVSEVKNMAGVIQPVVAMFKTPQIAGIQYAEAELELLLKTHLGDGLYQRKPQHLAVGSESVDFIIRLPDCVIPIDSKFPEAVYRAWTDAKDEAEAKPRWRSFRDAMQKQLEATAKYIRPQVGTTDYALLFVPSDVIWQQAFLVSRWYGEDNPLPRRCQELRVFGCSAQSLMPYIGLLRLGLRNLKVAEDVKAVRQQIDQLKTTFGRFMGDWSTLRGHLDRAHTASLGVEGAKGSLSAMQRDVDQLTAHDVGNSETPNRLAPTQPSKPAMVDRIKELT